MSLKINKHQNHLCNIKKNLYLGISSFKFYKGVLGNMPKSLLLVYRNNYCCDYSTEKLQL